MGDATSISWTDATWNPIRGCSRVSDGCVNCYAERVANRFSGPGKPYEGLVNQHGRWNGKVRVVAEHLADPLRWKKPRRIFVNSMSDLFHESLTNEQIAAVFGVMAAAPQHTFQVLTKRAKRMREWFEWIEDGSRALRRCGNAADRAGVAVYAEGANGRSAWNDSRCVWPLPNVWLGVSVENHAAADDRIPELLATPAAVRFLSCEPLIGDVSLFAFLKNELRDQCLEKLGGSPSTPGVDWVIAGCESGPGARPCDVTWLRSLRDQCAAAGVPFFLKQAVGADLGKCDQGCGQRVTVYVHARGRASYSCGCTDEGAEDGDSPFIGFGEGSKRKNNGVIELPYLDGVQHAAFPEAGR